MLINSPEIHIHKPLAQTNDELPTLSQQEGQMKWKWNIQPTLYHAITISVLSCMNNRVCACVCAASRRPQVWQNTLCGKRGTELNNRCVNSVGIFNGGGKNVFAITENRGLIFPDDGFIIIRSASYLCLSGWVIDFNDSFFQTLTRFLSASSKWWWSVTDQIPLWHLIRFFSLTS